MEWVENAAESGCLEGGREGSKSEKGEREEEKRKRTNEENTQRQRGRESERERETFNFQSEGENILWDQFLFMIKKRMIYLQHAKHIPPETLELVQKVFRHFPHILSFTLSSFSLFARLLSFSLSGTRFHLPSKWFPKCLAFRQQYRTQAATHIKSNNWILSLSYQRAIIAKKLTHANT